MSMDPERCPKWIEKPMQSLAFWVGYQHSMYWHSDLPEGAITAELRRLIKAELPDRFRIVCESSYKNLSGTDSWFDAVRADLAIFRDDESAETNLSPIAVIEVKRASAARTLIEDDLIALSILKRSKPELRAFLLIVGECFRPSEFVGLDGKSSKEQGVILLNGKDKNIFYRSIRVTKAGAFFDNPESAHYCCLVEIIPGE